MNSKKEIRDISYIDDVSVLNEKYGIKSISEDGVLKDLNGEIIVLPADIEQKRAELVAEYNYNNYQRKRRLEYPPITEYIDGVVKGDQAQIDAYIQKCLEVKQKYPKP